MKLAIISDIHGNISALEAALKELEKQDVNKIICLGDLIGGAPFSEQVVQKIMQIKDKLIIVRGNREKYITEGMPKVVHDEKVVLSQEQLDRHEWMKRQLSETTKEYIHTLPKELIYNVEGKKIYIAHYPMKEDGNFRKHIKGASAEENEIMFSGIDADIYLYGHTHEEIYNSINNKVYINPGALGCPGETNFAPYGILNINKSNIEYQQLYATYDAKKVIEEIERIKFPGYKGTLRVFYGIKE